MCASKLLQRRAALWTRGCQTWISEFSVQTQKNWLAPLLLQYKHIRCFHNITFVSKPCFAISNISSPVVLSLLLLVRPLVCVCLICYLFAERWCSSRRRQTCHGANEAEGPARALARSSRVLVKCGKQARKCSELEAGVTEISFSCQEWKLGLNSQKHPDQAAVLSSRGHTLEL